MLLSNWLRSLFPKYRPTRPRSTGHQRRRSFNRHQPALARRPVGIEQLEDRTMLTSVITIDDRSVYERDTELTSFLFSIRRTGSSPGDLNSEVSINFTTQDDTATTTNNDYATQTGTLFFSADATSTSQRQYLTIKIKGDFLPEENETFQVLITTNDPDTTISKSIGIATILNDDFGEINEVQSVTPPAPVSANDSFGEEIAIDGDYMVVGATNSDVAALDAGAAYIYQRNHQGTMSETDDTWEFYSTLTAPDASTGDLFGTSVAIHGDVIVIGAAAADNGGEESGAAYVYRRNGALWSFEEKLIASDRMNYDGFGNDVAIENNRIVVGAANHDVDSKPDAGAVYIFSWSGNSWTETQKLTYSSGESADQFGYSVAIHNNEIFISAPNETINQNSIRSGEVHVYHFTVVLWIHSQRLAPSNGRDNQRFGWQLAVDGNHLGVIIAGSTSGSPRAYLYEREGGSWKFRQSTIIAPITTGISSNRYSIDISETTLAIGTNIYDSPIASAGSVTIYHFSEDRWVNSQDYIGGNPSDRDLFGAAVAISGSQILVGAPASDDTAMNSGAVRVLGPFPPGYYISDVTALEGDDGTTDFQFTIERRGYTSGELNTESTIHFATIDGTATAASGDYLSHSGVLTFEADPAALFQTKTVTVSVNSDTIYEGFEQFYLELSDASEGFIIYQPLVTGSIEEDDYAIVSTTETQITVNESDGVASLTVVLDRIFTEDVVVPIDYVEGPAEVDTDLSRPPLSVTIPAGQLSTTITFDIFEDNIVERDENLLLYLRASENSRTSSYTLRVILTIQDNDQTTISISDAVINENQGSVTLTAQLSAPVQQEFSIDFTTQDNTAVNGEDYQTTSGTIRFLAGSLTSEPITIPIINSPAIEPNESFLVNLDNIQIIRFDDGKITFSDNQAEVTIIDHSQYFLTINDQTVNEAYGTVSLTVSLDSALPTAMSVDYSTFSQTATASNDFQTTSGTLSFSPGDVTKTITVPIINDTSVEGLETFLVNLSNLQSNGTDVSFTQDQAKVTITDNDQAKLSIDDLIVNEDVGTAAITVTLDQPVDDILYINFVIGGITASSNDFGYSSLNQPASSQIKFFRGEVSKTFLVRITEDDYAETDETFRVRIDSTSQDNNADILVLDNEAEVTILDNDQATVSINDVSVDETAGTATLTISLDKRVEAVIGIQYNTADQTATKSQDYSSQTGYVILNPTMLSMSFTIPLIDDLIIEDDETFLVNLTSITTNGTNTVIGDDQAVVTILDNERPVKLSISDLTITESVETATVIVSLEKPVESSISVDFSSVDQTATNPTDYLTTSGVLTFNPGETSKEIPVSILNNSTPEIEKSFLVNLSNLQANGLNVVLADNQAEITIIDDDQANLSINDVSVNESAGTATLTFTLDQLLTFPVTVDYTTTNQTATNPDDYFFQSGSLTFNPNEQSKTITLDIIDDNLSETNEKFLVNLTNIQANGADIVFTDNQAEITILDDDYPLLSINDLSVNETDGIASVTVSMDKPVNTPVSIDFTIVDQTASNSTDYLFQSGTLTFNPGEQSKTIDIEILNDAIVEGFETFLVKLSNLQTTSPDVSLAKDEATVTIVDDDQATFSINDISVDEFAETATLKVSLNRAVYSTVTVDYATADNTALNPTDYSTQSGTLTFFRGQQSRYITIPILDSSLVESSETFLVNLTNIQANGAQVSFADDQGEVTILDDEQASLTIVDLTLGESAGTAQITVSLDQPVESIVSVDFTTDDQTAVNTNDYQTTSGTLTFNPGEQTKIITVPVVNSDQVELDETFLVNLTNLQANGADIILGDNQATVTITDNDQAGISIDDLTVDENAGTATLTVSLDSPVDTSVSVDFATADQTAGSPSDFTSTNGTLTFNPGDQSQTIVISITNSDQVELTETFLVNLSGIQANGRNISFADDQAQVTIHDDDQATISIDDVTVDENTGTAMLTVSLDLPVDTTISVDYATADQTAAAPNDFTSTSGTLTFNPGDQSQTFVIPITNSDQIELDETFLVNLTNLQANGANIILGDNQATVTITDDDQAAISINDVTVDENAGTAILTVSLNLPVDTAISVDYTTAEGTASSPNDYTNTSGTLTFNPGDLSQTIVIPITDTDQIELDETFLVNLTNLQANGADIILGDNQAIVTITDNDQAGISIDDVSVDENAGTATLTVSLDSPVDTTVSVDFATADQTAAASDDYTSTSGTLTFNPGDQQKSITVSLVDSDLLEPDETFLVNLFNLQADGRNVTLTDSQAEVTILDDEIATAEINVRVVNTPTSTQPNGEAAALPENQNWISEWSTYWVEIWIDAHNPTEQGVFSAALDFNYTTEYTSATEIQFGAAFTQNQTGVINDQTGTVESLSAETNASRLGAKNQLLFARIKFEPLADDQVALDLSGKSIGPHDLGLGVSSAQVNLEGNIPATTNPGSFNGASIYANPLDFDDNDAINIRDLIIFINVYNSVPSTSSSDYSWFADLDQNDHVNIRDLILFIGNYGKNKSGSSPVNYPDNYPDDWNDLLTVDAETEPPSTPQTISQSTAETALESVVEQVSPALSASESETLEQIDIQVVDLEGDTLGRAAAGTIYIDVNAAGYGWFVDTTPTDHSEFAGSSELTLIALPDSEAAGQIDLLTVILHELGHILGYEHENEGVMQDGLAPGVRNLPTWGEDLDDFFSDLTKDLNMTAF
ncbi:Calx-beta domain protein [Gimesia alba]|uniref:Calx-beta domain protein n=1 Tax=Gimesia alba TaxID=2527973 RepID=A0A517RGX6_9PLAN|nr:Calx-beta domain-containing protein [Gimesia alba]QDT43126.1 Calx-beta domain protein [Gimesia alba]